MDIDEASYRRGGTGSAELSEKRSHRSICRSVRTDSSSATSTCCSSGRSAGRRTARLRRRTFRIIQKENLGICREALMEAVAETSEAFMDRYFGGENSPRMRSNRHCVNVAEGSIVPVLMGSNILARGIYTLLVDIVKYLPSPEKRTCTGINAKTNEVYMRITISQRQNPPISGKQSQILLLENIPFIKVNSGVLKTDDILFNQHKDVEEKVGKALRDAGQQAGGGKGELTRATVPWQSFPVRRRPILSPQRQSDSVY